MKGYRTDIPNTFHHINSRGVNKLAIFNSDDDKNIFIKMLREELLKTDLEIISYIIMNNHFHFFVKRNTKAISEFMHNLLTRFALWYNKIYKRTGHVFERRYHSVLVDYTNYFKNVIVYIHKNIIRKDYKIPIDEYKWSSFKDYIKFDDSIIKLKFLNDFKIKLNYTTVTFKEFFYKIHIEDIPLTYKTIRNHNIMGNKEFVEYWMEFLKDKKRGSISVRKCIELEEIFQYIEMIYKIKKNDILNPQINYFKVIDARRITFLLCNKFCRLKNVEISKIFGKSESIISQSIKRITYDIEKLNEINIKFINFINTKKI